jgi:hypothetical protein
MDSHFLSRRRLRNQEQTAPVVPVAEQTGNSETKSITTYLYPILVFLLFLGIGYGWIKWTSKSESEANLFKSINPMKQTRRNERSEQGHEQSEPKEAQPAKPEPLPWGITKIKQPPIPIPSKSVISLKKKQTRPNMNFYL